jgi:hypothetical protein
MKVDAVSLHKNEVLLEGNSTSMVWVEVTVVHTPEEDGFAINRDIAIE